MLFIYIDKICNLEIDNVEKVFISVCIEIVVDKVVCIIGILRFYVFLVKNYEMEILLKININILVLIIFCRLLMFVDDFFEN